MLKLLISRTLTALEWLLMFSLFMMVVINFADVSGRHLFNHPIFGIQDLTEHLMALVVFCGLPLVTMAGTHLTVDLLDQLMNSPKMQWWKSVVIGLMVVILVLMTVTFIQSAWEAQAIADVSPELRLPRGPLYAFMALSALFSVLGLLYVNYAQEGQSVLPKQPSSGGEL